MIILVNKTITLNGYYGEYDSNAPVNQLVNENDVVPKHLAEKAQANEYQNWKTDNKLFSKTANFEDANI